MTAAPGEIAVRRGDIAVSANLAVALGTSRPMLEAVLVGAAQMFSLGTSGALVIGPRNDATVRAALGRERIRVAVSATGGSNGRTIPVYPGGAVLSKEAGGAEIELMRGVRP